MGKSIRNMPALLLHKCQSKLPYSRVLLRPLLTAKFNGLKTDKNGNRTEIKWERNGNGTKLPVPLYGRSMGTFFDAYRIHVYYSCIPI